MRPLLTTKSLGIIALLIGVMTLWPAPAHAFSIVEVFAPKGLLMAIIFILHVVHLILVALVASLGGILNIVLGLDLNYGGPAVYAVWEVFRDICNSLFIVFFILIAFGTIFKTVWKSMSGFYYQSALMNVLVAAILINFSLPIGQTIVWFGNQATSMMAGLMVGQDIGGTIYTALQIQERAEDGSPSLPSSSLPDLVTPIEKQPAAQQVATKNYLVKAKTAYENCLKGNQKQNPGECIALAQSLSAASNAKDLDASAGSYTDAALRAVASAWQYAQETANSALATAKNMGLLDSFPGLVKRVISLTINNILLFSLLFSFLLAIVVMVWRIPMIWILLASSSGTFFSYAIPGNEGLKKWFNNMIGYSLFGPLYLFAIYIGMFVLSQQNTLLAGLNNAPWIDGVLGIFLFYFLAFGTFTFGAKLAWDTAFKFSDSLKASVTSIGKFMGVSPDTNFGLNTLANFAATNTGAKAAYEAAKARGAQELGDLSANVRGRFPGFKSDEESLAYNKMKLGVRGADAEYDKLIQKRVTTQQDIQKSQKLTDVQLRAIFNGKNRDAALAAGESLLKKGQLNTSERSKLLSMYDSISPVAKDGAQKRITEQLQKQAGDYSKYINPTTGALNWGEFIDAAKQSGRSEDRRKFLEAAMRGEVGNRASMDASQLEELADLMDNPDDKRAFFEAATKNGRNKVVAIQTMADQGLITDRNGIRLTATEAITNQAKSFSDYDFLDVEAYFEGIGSDMTPALKEQYLKFIKNPTSFDKMSKDALDIAQRQRIRSLASELAHDEANAIELSNDQVQASKSNAIFTKNEKAVSKAKQRIADEIKIYKSNPTKANKDKIARAASEYRDALAEYKDYKRQISS